MDLTTIRSFIANHGGSRIGGLYTGFHGQIATLKASEGILAKTIGTVASAIFSKYFVIAAFIAGAGYCANRARLAAAEAAAANIANDPNAAPLSFRQIVLLPAVRNQALLAVASAVGAVATFFVF